MFDRAPDPEGRAFWNNSLDQGYSFTVLADHFMRAPEFAATYGQPTNRAFVESLYRNILDRPGEAEGIAFWTDALDSGRAQRADIVIGFSESPEHVVQMAAAAASAETTTLPETNPGPYATAPDGSLIPRSHYTRVEGDVLVGGDGFDDMFAIPFPNATFWGQGGDDKLYGRDGNETMHGGPGNDVLTGGPGNGVFRFFQGGGGDTITDFQRGDRIELVGGGFGVASVYTGTDALILDLNMAREGESTVTFGGLTLADEGWVRDAIFYGWNGKGPGSDPPG